ncbi:McrC family protein [Methanococcus maripaludis]|uniref:5-methylcytosine-specific restriction enzyme subunit McrC n=2 Tax=Methanococcus maripaludis TaxID=39152 RepID=A0A7J9PES8_METMI|nr:McrC family protein [Methanococcus maripaludis]MBA2861763.1 5-methylcytosine-specific restriction enzyme subunit McrC [Methanococcus maripaludis]
MNNQFTVTEFGIIVKGNENRQFDTYISLKESVFNDLKTFILQNKDKNTDEFLTITYKKNYGEVLQAKNYVGIIQMKNGVTIEILPKIYGKSKDLSVSDTRKLFLKMLKTLKDSPFKKFDLSNLKTDRMPLNEIFITMFLDELSVLIKRGLKSDYIETQKNLNVLKGKLKFKEHIKHNLIHKERFFVEFDEFIKDMAENRIIKSTLKELSKRSKSGKNLKNISEYSFVFDEISESKNIEKDFNACKSGRLMVDYENILLWCRVFLKNESFINFKGSNVAFALLYPMEKIFESYLTYKLKKSGKFSYVKAQDSRFFLVKEDLKKMFKLKPDIYAEKDDTIYLIDAKWKILDVNSPNYGISQGDMYQLLSYAKIYENNCKKHVKMALVYPKTDKFLEKVNFEYFDEKNVLLKIWPFELV